MRFLVFSIILISLNVFAKNTCNTHYELNLEFAKMLHKTNQEIHSSSYIENTMRTLKKRGVDTSQNPSKKIAQWFDVLERIYTKNIERSKDHLRKFYHSNYIIKSQNVPESYYEFQKKLARQRGHGNIKYTEEMKLQEAMTLIENQQSSLNEWLDYLLSDDTKQYSFIAKHWAFTSMLKLSKFNYKEGKFQKRSMKTVAAFPELNREALANVIDDFENQLNNRVKSKKENSWLVESIARLSFDKMYGIELLELKNQQLKLEKLKSTVEGKWKKYPQGSDYLLLTKALEGKSTGWCTANKGTAQSHLRAGDFHVFFSNDGNGSATNPRVAIRMQGSEIAEIRGVANGQNIDEAIGRTKVVEAKLEEFGDKAIKFNKKNSDMKKLTELEKKIEQQVKVSDEDLIFLYEIEDKIEGFGYQKDPRIYEIISKREAKKDIFKITGIEESKVSLNSLESWSGNNIEFHLGNLVGNNGYLKHGKKYKAPRFVNGDFSLRNRRSIRYIQLPDEIAGNASFPNIRTLKGFQFPLVRGFMRFESLAEVENNELRLYGKGNQFIIRKISELDKLIVEPGVKLVSLTGVKRLDHVSLGEGLENMKLNHYKYDGGFNFPSSLRRLTLGEIGDVSSKWNLPEELKKLNVIDYRPREQYFTMPKSLDELYLLSSKGINNTSLPELIKERMTLDLRSSSKGMDIDNVVFPKDVANFELRGGAYLRLKNLNVPNYFLEKFNMNKFKNEERLLKILTIQNTSIEESLDQSDILSFVKYAQVIENFKISNKFKGELEFPSVEVFKNFDVPVNTRRITIDLDASSDIRFPEGFNGEIVFTGKRKSLEGITMPVSGRFVVTYE